MTTLHQRDDLRRQLRRLGVVRGVRALTPSPRRRVAIESLIAGAFHDTPHGRCFVAQTDLPHGQPHGDLAPADFLDLSPQALADVGGEPALAAIDPRAVLFLDTETTGLSGGSGTMAFMVGLGFFTPDGFRVLQTFLRDPGDEPALVAFLAEFLPRFRALVTFNGRGFDLPILQTRFVLARRPFPLTGAPHLDLLFPSRRLWRERFPSCALGALERQVLGVWRDQDDVPSGVIPFLYRNYLQTGDAREVARVFYHNRVDVLSMATLAVRLCRAFAAPQPDLSGPELYCLARWYTGTGGDVEGAWRAAAAAADLSPRLRRRTLHNLAAWLKRENRPAEAVEWWQQLALEDPDEIAAAVELAKLFEWQLDRPALAAGWTRLARGRAERWPAGPRREQALAGLERRLARLEKKEQQ